VTLTSLRSITFYLTISLRGLPNVMLAIPISKALRQRFAARHQTNKSCACLHLGAESNAFHVDFRMAVLR
jgi:hypothetical protein